MSESECECEYTSAMPATSSAPKWCAVYEEYTSESTKCCACAVKSALRGSQSAVPVTKSALRVHKVLRLPRNLHIEVHKVLCLPRNLHFEVHKVLRLPRNLHFEGHKVLRLPRNLHFEVHMLGLPKSAHRGSQCAPATKSANEPHPERRSPPSKITKVLCLPRNLHFEVKPAPIPCTCHEKSTLDHENTRFPLHLPRKVTTMCENAHGTTTRAQSLEAPAAGHPDFASLRSRNAR